ncbi:MAG: DUF5131 family protein [Silvibacterium sp.]
MYRLTNLKIVPITPQTLKKFLAISGLRGERPAKPKRISGYAAQILAGTFPKVIKRPQDRNVFTCSMADLFGKWVPDEWIARVFEQVSRYQRWNFLFLTKFPQRLRSVCDDLLKGFPDNAWVGCTVDSQARVKTAQEAFTGLRAKVRWLSVEPMQERLTFNDMSMFHWLVVGGKSASSFNGTPEFQPELEWVEDLFKQARAANLTIYCKENLRVADLSMRPREVPWHIGAGIL